MTEHGGDAATMNAIEDAIDNGSLNYLYINQKITEKGVLGKLILKEF